MRVNSNLLLGNRVQLNTAAQTDGKSGYHLPIELLLWPLHHLRQQLPRQLQCFSSQAFDH
jgi:hypothetical protein